MLKLRGFALFILAVCAVSFPARAETIMHNDTLAPDSLFMQFVTSQTFLEATVARTVRYERQFGLDCQEDFTMSLRGVRVVRPVVTVSDADQITTDGIAIPAGGVWIVGYLMGGCGEDRFYRAVARVADGGGVIIRVLVPGESQLNHMVIPRAQRVVAQMAAIENCPTVFIADTAVGAPDGVDVSNADATVETWTVAGCGQRVQVVWRLAQNDGEISLELEDRRVLN